jgi:cysteine sulfinate desulfinase/cysteine desulfurase-like protein/glyoxylase-like metal-dependent hydrolase (beta-lactamase superfamily II)/rhodanese-related sulfurtransferase
MKNPLMNSQAYFDCNATTPVLPIAAEAAFETMRSLYGNPSSAHLVGLQARHILESTRKLAAKALSTEPEQIIFTSGATEAVQTAVFSVLQAFKTQAKSGKNKLLYSATEHKVIPEALHHWVKALNLPLDIVELRVDSQGQIDLNQLQQELPQALLLCTMAVNNETGVIQNLSAIEFLLKEINSQTFWLVDCVQGLGKLELKMDSSRIDYAPFSGHKLYAPKGIGFLYVKKGIPITPLIVGGGQEKGFRSGTENLPGVAALGVVLEQLLNPSEKSSFHSHHQLVQFKNQIVSELKRAFPKIEFNTPFDVSVPTTINFSVPGLSSGELLDLFDSAGLRLSAGSACSSASVKPSPVLDAMGIPEWRSTSALRLSFGPYTSKKEIERGCQIIRECAIALQNTCLLETTGTFEAPESLRDGILQFRAGSTNSWIIADRGNRNCIIIDPCETVAERLEHYVRCQDLKVLAVLDTHSHADHDSIRPVLQKILSEQLLSSEFGFTSLGWPQKESAVTTSVHLENGQTVPALILNTTSEGQLVLASVKTPGHTDDSHTYLLGLAKNDVLHASSIRFSFVGDMILSGGLGRTNFSMSDPAALFSSLRLTQTVIGQTTLLCPAHDYNNSFATCLKIETEENSLLSLALGPTTALTLPSFIEKKKEIDSELAQIESSFQGVVCGVTPSSKSPCAQDGVAIMPEDFETFLNKSNQPLIVDVRESQEYTLFKDWKEIGLQQAPRNVPLSRFVNFLGEMAKESSHREILFICKSGSRSLQAAKSLRRLGFKNAFSLSGGIASALSAESIYQ